MLLEKGSAEFMEDEPPPRAKPGTTKDGKLTYPEEKLSMNKMKTGMREADLSESISEGIRKFAKPQLWRKNRKGSRGKNLRGSYRIQ